MIFNTKNLNKMGPWKENEDLKLLELVEKHGDKNWSKIAQ